MKACTYCGRRFSEGYQTCPACGSPLGQPGPTIEIEIDAASEYVTDRRPYRETDDRPAYRETEQTYAEQPAARENLTIDFEVLRMLYIQNQSFFRVQMLLVAALGLFIVLSTHFNSLRVHGFVILNGDYLWGVGIGIIMLAVGVNYALQASRKLKNITPGLLEYASGSRAGFLTLFPKPEWPLVKGRYLIPVMDGAMLFLSFVILNEEFSLLRKPLIQLAEPTYYLLEHSTSLAAAIMVTAITGLYLLRCYQIRSRCSAYWQVLQ